MLREWFNGLGRTPSFPPVDPEDAFSAIGDIHGRADLLDRALQSSLHAQIICVGDYVDRGEHSADVLRVLHARSDIICLSGNHEEMMLGFLDAPDKHGSHWLRFGGLQTLTSFGVSGISTASDVDAMTAARDALRDAMGEPLLRWMRSLPTRWQSGNVAVVHAGADPVVPIENQTTHALHWGHPDFARKQRADGVWVMHGHTIVDMPTAENGRISIDTGAYVTGKLTIANVDRGGVTFETIG